MSELNQFSKAEQVKVHVKTGLGGYYCNCLLFLLLILCMSDLIYDLKHLNVRKDETSEIK